MELLRTESVEHAHAAGHFKEFAREAPARGRLSGSPHRDTSPAHPGKPARFPSGAHERALGRVLARVRDAQVHRALGYVRLGDYLGERVGMSLRTAQELMRTHAELAALPAVAAALERGEITSAHVRLITRVASAADQEMWVARARRRSVRQLARDVALARREAEALAGSSPAGERADIALASRMIDPEPALTCFKLRAPGWISSMWREVKVRVRRLAGSLLPAGACLEPLLAEGSPAGWHRPDSDGYDGETSAREGDASRPSEEVRGSEADSASVSVPGDPFANPKDVPMAAAGFVPGNSSAGLDSAVPGASAEGPREGDPADPREVDLELRRLVSERQVHEAGLANELARARAGRSHLLAGYESLEAFALDRYGLSPRRLYYMLALHRDLDRLPDLRFAFVGGRVTLRKTLLVAKVASLATVEAWIRRAESVTLRRLEDEVDFWTHLRDTRYEVWRRLKGRPLPDGIVLEPGKEPRLHRTAHAGTLNQRQESKSSESGDDLHPSARSEAAETDPVALNTGAETLPKASDFVKTVTAETLLAALEADEGLTPLPEKMCDIEMDVEPDVMEMWNAKVAELRASIRPDLQEWEVLALLMHHFVTTWDTKETRRQARENPVLERGGWRCAVPGCRSVGSGNLQTHHVVFRSAGGAVGDPSNEIGVCNAHHLDQIHRGIVRVKGRAPDALIWEMGLEPGRPERRAHQVFAGDVLVR